MQDLQQMFEKSNFNDGKVYFDGSAVAEEDLKKLLSF